MTVPHHSEPAREAVAQWRYSINYGPDGEANYANVHAADGQFVGNLRTHHAIAICNAFAVCERLAASPAPAAGGLEAVRGAETLWCESCGEAPMTVRHTHAGLCADCAKEQGE